MSTTTTNLELVKPAGNERVDVDVINGNYDKIDEFAGLAITDANYVHTDNNYTTTEKNKLSAIQPNATATSFTQTLVSGTAVGTITINGTAYTIYAPSASGGASALNDLTDVTLASPSNGQVLKYNSTTGKWENADESGGGGGYIPTGEVYTFFTDGSSATANYSLYVQWTDGETVTTALIVTFAELISGWTTDDYQNVTINWDSSNQNFNFVAKSGSFECSGTYFDEGDTMGTLSSGSITFNAMEKEATGVDWTQVQLSGTKIAEIEIDGVSQNVYAPTPPTKTSDLTNDSNFVADASYVHTDNNYTTTEKNKLANLNQVEANPSSGTSAGNLNSIEIGGTKYDIPSGGGGGTTVIANPSGTPTDELEKLQVGSTIYSIPSGGGSAIGKNDILWEYSDSYNIMLAHPFTDYDFLVFEGNNYNDSNHKGGAIVSSTELEDIIGVSGKIYTFNGAIGKFANYIVGSTTSLTYVEGEARVLRVWGIKLGSAYKEVTGTLTAGQTEITLYDASITENSTLEPFTNKFGVNPTGMEIDETGYSTKTFADGKIVIKENSNKKLLFFVGYTKSASDVTVDDPELLEYLSDISSSGYGKASISYNDSSVTTQNGWIGFYKLYSSILIRSWSTSWGSTISGTFYAVMDLTIPATSNISSDAQQDPYYSPESLAAMGVKLTFPVQSENLNVKVRVS